jgi:hypothetical protein
VGTHSISIKENRAAVQRISAGLSRRSSFVHTRLHTKLTPPREIPRKTAVDAASGWHARCLFKSCIDVSSKEEEEMNRIKKSALAALAVMMMVTSLTFAQGPLQKRVNYTISVPYSLRMGDYMLSPGRYVLYEINANDPNLFALYADNMTHSPVAMIRTARVEYRTGEYPSKTKLMLDIDESGDLAQPVIRGWTIPGEDGWEIISVVAKDDHYMTRVK